LKSVDSFFGSLKAGTCNRLFLLLLLVTTNIACSTKIPQRTITVESPLGLYCSDTDEKFWLAIMSEYRYLLCSPQSCYRGKYEAVAVDYGVILIDFFLSEQGLAIENLSHGDENSEAFYQAMRKLRLEQIRPNDFAFNIGECNGTPCVGIGHARDGVKFYKVEDFDSYWPLKKRPNKPDIDYP